jgi:hypothetical protein
MCRSVFSSSKDGSSCTKCRCDAPVSLLLCILKDPSNKSSVIFQAYTFVEKWHV